MFDANWSSLQCKVCKYCQSTVSGQCISWVTELRYLGIFLTCSRIFTCSTDSAKRSFYRSANAIFGKVGRIASEETVLELIKTKCIPALMFGMEACPLKKRDINSLDFVVNRLFMKLLKTSDINIVRTCQHMFGFELPRVLLDRRTRKFLEKMKNLRVEVNHFKIDCSLIVMFFTKPIIVVFTLCLLIVFSLFIML